MFDRKRTLRQIVCLSGLILLLLVSHAAAVPEYRITNISDPALDAVSSVLSGDHVIYAGTIGDAIHENSTRVIQLHSLPDGGQTRLAMSDPGFSLAGEDIDGNYAVWFSEPGFDMPQDTPNRIFLWSVTEQNLTVIRTQPGAEWPKISRDTVIWSESSDDSIGSQVMLYDIPTGSMAPVPNISTIDGAGVAFNNRYILYSGADTGSLLLCTPATGVISTVFASIADNTTHEMVFGSALAGDFVLYRKDVRVDDPREMYSELCLYTISTGKTVLISPVTGAVTETLSESDKNAAFTVGGADEGRVVWYVTEGIADDRIMVLDIPSMSVTSVSPHMSVYSLSMDGRDLAWKGTETLFGKGTIYLATESRGEEGAAAMTPEPRPTKSGLSVIIAFAGIAICGALVLLRKME